MAVGRIRNGIIRVGQRIAVVREEADDTAGEIEPGRTITFSGTVTSLQTAHGMERIDIAEAGPGEIVSVAGLPEVTIGDTLTDPGDPRPLPRLDVDEPMLSHDVRGEHVAPRRHATASTSRRARSRPASSERSWATSRSRSTRPIRATRSRCAAAVSSSWPC